MTPKQQYEARKAERDKLQDMDLLVRERTSAVMMLDMLDRFVTAAERIADTMDRSRPDERLTRGRGWKNCWRIATSRKEDCFTSTPSFLHHLKSQSTAERV